MMFFQEWFLKPGDTVAQFDNICDVLSNKASTYDGVLTNLYYWVDDIAQTGDPLVDVEIAGSGAELEPVATPAEEEAAATPAAASAPTPAKPASLLPVRSAHAGDK